MKKNYKEVYQAAIKGYKENKQEGAASLLNKLTKKELLEMNEQLNITVINKSATKDKIIDNIIFFGIRSDIDSEALRTVDIR